MDTFDGDPMNDESTMIIKSENGTTLGGRGKQRRSGDRRLGFGVRRIHPVSDSTFPPIALPNTNERHKVTINNF